MLDINLQTKIADLLTAYPQLEDKLISISPLFAKLQNPILRRTVAKVTSVQQAASIANIAPPHLVKQLREIVGLTMQNIEQETDTQNTPKPSWWSEDKIAKCFDATPIIESGESPMQTILQLSSELQGDTILEITAPFRPAPILDILASKGFKVWSENRQNYIYREI